MTSADSSRSAAPPVVVGAVPGEAQAAVPAGPWVTAVLVSQSGDRYLPRTLDAVAAQTRAPDLLLGAAVGDGCGTSTLVAATPGTVQLPAGTSFGDGVRAALVAFQAVRLRPAPEPRSEPPVESGQASADPAATASELVLDVAGVDVAGVDVAGGKAAGGAAERSVAGAGQPAAGRQWLWLLHDDAAPAPDALEQLLAAVETGPSVGIAGCKQVAWDDDQRLLDVGFSVSRQGVLITGVDRYEVDQGQHDDRCDVLAVSSAGMLIRRDVWQWLDGFDPALAHARDDLELCRRARLAGHRVVVVPTAVVAHAAGSALGERTGEPGQRGSWLRADRRDTLHLRYAATPWLLLPLVVTLSGVATVVRAAVRLGLRQPRKAVDELLAWPLATCRPRGWLSTRRRVAAVRVVPRRTLRSLQPTRRQLWRHRREVVAVWAGRTLPAQVDAPRTGGRRAERVSARSRSGAIGPGPASLAGTAGAGRGAGVATGADGEPVMGVAEGEEVVATVSPGIQPQGWSGSGSAGSRRARRRAAAVRLDSVDEVAHGSDAAAADPFGAVADAVSVAAGSAVGGSVGGSVVAVPVEAGPADAGPADAGALLRRDTSWSGLVAAMPVTLIAAAASVAALHRLLTSSGATTGPSLLPMPDTAGALWRVASSTWRAVGLGASGVADPFTAVLAGLGALLGGSPGRAVDVLLVAGLPLAAVSAWIASGRVTRARGVRMWAALAWAACPSLLGAVAGGRPASVLAHVLLPLVALTLARAVGAVRFGQAERSGEVIPRGSPAAAAMSGILLTLTLAAAPSLVVPALFAVLALLVVAPVRRGLLAISVLAPAILLLPWWLAVRSRPQLLLADPALPVQAADPTSSLVASAPAARRSPGCLRRCRGGVEPGGVGGAARSRLRRTARGCGRRAGRHRRTWRSAPPGAGCRRSPDRVAGRAGGARGGPGRRAGGRRRDRRWEHGARLGRSRPVLVRVRGAAGRGVRR
jgi:GT2 family glycosyltransferase